MRDSLIGWLLAVSMAAASAPVSGQSIDHDERMSAIVMQGLLDVGVPMERRRQLGKQFEDAAMQGDATWLYALGSLYRIGDGNPSSPFPKDIDKAREYLSRAALRGQRSAMAKLVFLEVDAGNRFEANVWAQMFVHYQAIGRSDEGDSLRGVHATVLSVAQDGFPESDVARLEQRVMAMIASYDAAIRTGLEKILQERAKNPLNTARGERCSPSRAQFESGRVRGKSASAGGAEYFITFAANGRVADAWMLDAWPDLRVERTLRACVPSFRVSEDAARLGAKRVGILPVMLVDPRVRLRQAH